MTSLILDAIQHHVHEHPAAVALQGSNGVLSYSELSAEILRMQMRFASSDGRVIGLAIENSPAWAVADIAAMAAQIPLVPLPAFFSPEQIIHAIHDAGINKLVCDQPIVMENLLQSHGVSIAARQSYQVAGRWLTQLSLADVPARLLPPGTIKVTYTSGTTGSPKGVCLGLQAIEQVATSLLSVTEATDQDKHLSILPLSTLLENIAGLYVPLMAGARSMLFPSNLVGLSGATGIDPQKMLTMIQSTLATTLVLTPELLKTMVMMAEVGLIIPKSLRFIAVGGAAVSYALLERAAKVGLPVFEGYGLSECCSVVSVNTAKIRREGSVGKPLPHVKISFAEDGEILVAGCGMLGYTGTNAFEGNDQSWPTGDIGYLDDAGYLYIDGRKKNMFITSFGRNVSPEWVESQLTQSPLIVQAALFGEAKSWNTALIFAMTHISDAQIDLAIHGINAGLPDYARVHRWLRIESPFSIKNQQLTPNFRLRRDVIWQAYANEINELYEETKYACV
ncbi:MAG: AMP-binding protein [Nitrosomonadales bacterium]|nr:AMP-binding protein [Nitrosomonadales bacterium]